MVDTCRDALLANMYLVFWCMQVVALVDSAGTCCPTSSLFSYTKKRRTQ
jgi:hypothetical protein